MLSDACAEFLADLENSLTEPKMLVRRLLVELKRYEPESYGYARGEIPTCRRPARQSWLLTPAATGDGDVSGQLRDW